MQFLKM